MSNQLNILAREFDKYYDKKCNFKDAITLMTQQLRNEAEKLKEKVDHGNSVRYVQGCPEHDSQRRKAVLYDEGKEQLMEILTETFLEDRDTYIHYSSKIESLHSERQKKESTGIKISSGQMDKFARVA
jgi:hypothetical protein